MEDIHEIHLRKVYNSQRHLKMSLVSTFQLFNVLTLLTARWQLPFLILFFVSVAFCHAVEECSPFPTAVSINEPTDMDDSFNPEDAGNRFISPYDAMANMPHNVMEFEHASGNWGGGRDFLDRHGVEISLTYTSDMAGNPVGGISPHGFTYCDNIALGLFLQTEKLFGWKDGYFMMSLLQRDGLNLSQKNIGNQFTVQQVFGGPTFHWYELSYEQKFFDAHASVKLGRIAAGDDFAVSPLYWLYMNNGIDGNLQALPVNGRFSTYPNTVWGSRLKVDLTSTTVARLGVYQATPLNSINGLNWDFYPSNGVMLLGQYSWNPEFFHPSSASLEKETAAAFSDSSSNKNINKPSARGLDGHYWMGGYYSTMEYSQFNSSTMLPNAYGFYWHADQTVYRVDSISDKGLILWSAYALSPQQNVSKVSFQVNGGAVYTGLIPARDNDATILGFIYGNFSSSYAGAQQAAGNGSPNYELVYEAGYRINFTKFAYFQPDVQWIINPGGLGSTPNALVIGAQTGVIF